MGNTISEQVETDIKQVVDATSAVHLTRRFPRNNKSWKDVFKSDPELATRKNDRTGQLPLHFAIDANAPEDLVKIIVSLNPDAIVAVDEGGYTPLCHGIVNKCPQSLLEALLDGYRAVESLLIADQQGLLPLHHAIKSQYPCEFLLKLLHMAPMAAQSATRMSKYALHYAAEHQVDAEFVDALIKEYPDVLEETCDTRLPLHYAAEYRASIEVTKMIYDGFQDAAACKSIDGMLPVHMAVQNRAPVKVVELLIGAYIDALVVRDRRGRMPLHYALERKAPESLVLSILKASPATASYKGHGSPGDLPLVVAIGKHYSHEVVAEICRAYPAGVKVPNSFNMLPLRCALQSNASIETLALLLEYDAEAASEVDEHGRVALHYAISRDMPLPLVQTLLSAYPAGARVQDKNGQLPVHIACTRKCSLELLQLLLAAYPDGLVVQDRYKYVAINHAIENDAPLPYFEAVISASTACLQNRCAKGRLPLHQAIEFKQSTEVINAIVQGYPEAAADHELKEQRIPLQWAIERLLPLPTLLCIHHANPVGGARVYDAKGWYTIHYAIHYPTPVEIVRLLLASNNNTAQATAHPLHMNLRNQLRGDVIDTQEATGELLAVKDAFLLLHYAVHYDALPTTVAEILLFTLPITTSGDIYDSHCDTWAFILTACNDRYWESVDIALTHYEHDQTLIQRLADFPDRNTQRAIDMAQPRSLHQIVRRLHLFSRYETYKGLSIHKSKRNLIHSAIDHDGVQGSTTNVVLKFTSNRSRFKREVKIRTEAKFDTQYVLEMKRSHDSQEDRNYRMEIDLKGYAEYPFLIVLSRGERDLLSIAKHENFAGTNINVARHYGRKLLLALQYVHSVGVVHGDLKPSNVVRENTALKIMNFGASSRLALREMVSADLDALGYAAPELAAMYRALLTEGVDQQQTAEKHYDYINSVPRSNSIDERRGTFTTAGVQPHTNQEQHSNYVAVDTLAPGYEDTQRDQPHDLFTNTESNQFRIAASVAQDMWSFGAILYLLCTGESLFLTTLDEHIDDDQLDLLCDWPDFAKERRLRKVEDHAARAIISQLLNKSPQLRPDAEYCLHHPFFASEIAPTAVRFHGAAAESDVVLIYRPSQYGSALRFHDGLPAQRPMPPAESEGALGQYGGIASQLQHHSLSTVQSVGTGASQPTDETELNSEQRRARDEAVRRMFGSLAEGSLSTEASLESSSQNIVTDQERARDGAIALAKYRKQCQQRLMHGGPVDDDFHCQLLCEELNYHSLKVAITQPHPLPSPPGGGGNSINSTSNQAYDVDIHMTKASAAVIVLSRHSFQTKSCCKLDKLTERSEFDSFYYEMRLVLELVERNYFEKGIYLLAIGDVIGSHPADEQKSAPHTPQKAAEAVIYDSYFESYMGDMVGRYGGSHSYSIADVVVHSVESRVKEFLTKHGLGLPLYPNGISMKSVMQKLTQLPTFYIIGEQQEAFWECAGKISDLIQGVGAIVLPSTPYSRPSTGAFAMLDRSRLVTPALRSSRSNANTPSVSASAAASVSGNGLKPLSASKRSSWAAASPAVSRSRRGSAEASSPGYHSRVPQDMHRSMSAAAYEETRYFQSKQPHQSQSGYGDVQYTYYPNRGVSNESINNDDASNMHPSGWHTPYQYVGSSPISTPLEVSRATSRGRNTRPGSMQDICSGNIGRVTLPDISNVTTNSGFSDWSRSYTTGAALPFGLQDDSLDEFQGDRIVYFNDEVKLPHLTEIVGVERAKTADTLRFLAEKLEVSENEVFNLEDELALLKERMNKKDDEISRLRRSLNITLKDGSLPHV